MEDTRLAITPVTDLDEMITYWPYIKDTELCGGGQHAVLLRECLNGNYQMSKGTENGELRGIVIFSALPENTCFIYILHGVNHVRKFKNVFLKACWDAGYRRILASTTIDEKIYTRLMGTKKLYSVYEYDLTQEEM